MEKLRNEILQNVLGVSPVTRKRAHGANANVVPKKKIKLGKANQNNSVNSSMETEEGDQTNSANSSMHDVNLCEDDHNPDICECHLDNYLRYAENKLTDQNMLFPLIKRLNKEKVLDDFISLMQQLSTGALHPKNLPLLTTLDRSNWQKCTTSTKMVYYPETIDFWQMVKRTCKYSGLLLFSGLKHGGQVSQDKCAKGKYPPESASINFAVPHCKTLAKHEIKVPKYIPPGIIQTSFELIDKSKQYVLEYDGKGVSRGLQANNVGDIDLWGLEGPPNLKSLENALQQEIDTIAQLSESDHVNSDETKRLEYVLRNISRRINDVRKMKMGHKLLKVKLDKMCNSHPKTAKRYGHAMATVKGSIFLCDNWIKRALQLNKRICEILSLMQNNIHHFEKDDAVDAPCQSNMRLLNPPENINPGIDLYSHPEIIKQRSKLFTQLQNTAKVTSTSCYNALGLNTMKDQREHFKQLLSDKTSHQMSPDEALKVKTDIANKVIIIIPIHITIYGNRITLTFLEN